MNINRPSSKDSFDDILNFQETWQNLTSETNGSFRPAAEVIRMEKSTGEKAEELCAAGASMSSSEAKSDADPTVLISEVTEKCYSEADMKKFFSLESQLPSLKPNRAFPEVVTLNSSEIKKSSASKERKSLFAQQQSRIKSEKTVVSNDGLSAHNESTNLTNPLIVGLQRSSLIDGSGLALGEVDVQKIHEENLQRLSNFSEEDILAEQKRLLDSLDPNLLAYLKGRKQFAGVNDHKRNDVDREGTAETLRNNSTEVPDCAKSLKGLWMNMDEVELDKLAWMSETVAEEKTTAVTARFDLNGSLVSPHESAPSWSALYHHGDDSDSAGYSISDLFQLLQSANANQQIFALTTIGQIICNYRSNLFTELDPPLLPALIESNIVILIRVLLDSNTVSVISAALYALKCLLVHEDDEKLFDPISQPKLLPSLQPSIKIESPNEMIDQELLQHDVVLGLLRMNIIERIRYVCLNFQLDSAAYQNIIDILTRIAVHSQSATYNVKKTAGLLEHFIEKFWLPSRCESSTAQIRCFKSLVNLLYCVCFAGQSIAEAIESDFCLTDKLIIVLSDCETLMSAFGDETCEVLKGLFRLLWLFLKRKIGLQSFSTILMKLVEIIFKYPKANLSLFSEPDVSSIQLTGTLTLLTVILEHVTEYSLGPPNRKAVKFQTKADFILPWTDLVPFGDPVFQMFCKLCKEFEEFSIDSEPMNLELFTAVVTFLTGFLSKMHRQPDSNAHIEFLSKLTEVLLNLPAMWSFKFTLRRVSVECLPSKVPLIPVCLPCYSTMKPSFLTSTSLRFVAAIMDLFYSISKQLSPENAEHIVRKLCLDEEIISFVINVSTKSLNSSYVRLNICAKLISLAFRYLPVSDLNRHSYYHDCLLRLSFSLHYGQEEMLSITMDSFFSEKFLQDMARLPNIKEIYFKAYGYLWSQAEQSQSVTFLKNVERNILPVDWPFKLETLIVPTNEALDDTIPAAITDRDFVDYLTLINVLNEKFDHVFAASSPSYGLNQFHRLVSLFLDSRDIFLSTSAQSLLHQLIKNMCKPSHLQNIDFSAKVSGVSSFYDVYIAALDKFQACSYGSNEFATVILYPIRQMCPVEFRGALWSEYSVVLRSIRLRFDQLLIPTKSFLEPDETNVNLLRHYAAALFDQVVTFDRNQVLYLIAVHHLNSLVFSPTKRDGNEYERLRRYVVRKCYKTKHQCCEHVLRYKLIDENGTLSLYEILPEIRRSKLDSVMK